MSLFATHLLTYGPYVLLCITLMLAGWVVANPRGCACPVAAPRTRRTIRDEVLALRPFVGRPLPCP